MGQDHDPTLCSPGHSLSCFACCPPIRPAGYDHADHRGPLTRQFSANRAAFLTAGDSPQKQSIGFSCPGLGFLDHAGKMVGCLFHPVQNQGEDLRGPTGYREKCARESCAPSRAFGALNPAARSALLYLCRGMDPFTFSSPRLNPLMRLLALGPVVSGAAAELGPGHIRDLAAWDWMQKMEPAWGWLAGRLVAARGREVLLPPGPASLVEAEMIRLEKQMQPLPPREEGNMLSKICDEWEARFWRRLSGRNRIRPRVLARWRVLL